jgi:hypothetical protein
MASGMMRTVHPLEAPSSNLAFRDFNGNREVSGVIPDPRFVRHMAF